MLDVGVGQYMLGARGKGEINKKRREIIYASARPWAWAGKVYC